MISKILIWIIANSYFRKIVKCDNFTINETRNAQIFALSHRNGAVDGWVYAKVFKNTVFLLARQLQRNFFLRLLFPGIAILRQKDAPKSYKRENIKAFKELLEALNSKIICIFPEGTSSLGPKHLPFENGISKIAANFTKQNQKSLEITPFSIFYDDPTSLGGKAFVKMGQKFIANSISEDEIQQNLTQNLEEILLDYESEEDMLNAHKIAVFATVFDENKNYAEILFALKNNEILTHNLTKILQTYEANLSAQNLLFYKEILIYPKNILTSLWTLFITSVVVVPTFALNFAPLLCGFVAGKKSSEKHTISLYKILAGYFAGVVFYLILLVLFGIFYGAKGIFFALALCAFSLWGFRLYGAFKKHLIALLNLIKFKNGRAEFIRIYDEISKNF